MNYVSNSPVIGIIGGTGWPSTITYLQEISRRVREKLGGLHSPNLVLVSSDFDQLDTWMHQGNWHLVQELFTDQMVRMKRSHNIDAVVVLSNTLHKVAEEAAHTAGVPLIHIGDCTAKMVWGQCLDKIGFIGTKFTMQEDFILKYYREQGIEVVTPSIGNMEKIDDIIFNELCRDDIREDSRNFLFKQVAQMLKQDRIEAIVLGCTELGLTMTEKHWIEYCARNKTALHKVWKYTAIPFIDATECHIDAIVAYCLHSQQA